eukprot:g8567.t1
MFIGLCCIFNISCYSSLQKLRYLDMRRIPVDNGPSAYAQLYAGLFNIEFFKCDWIPSSLTYRLMSLLALPNITDDLWPNLIKNRKREKKIYLASGIVVEEEHHDETTVLQKQRHYYGRVLTVDEQIDFILRNSLKKLELVDLRGITSKTAKVLAYKPIDTLKTLILHDLPNWALGATSFLCASCGNLTEINFSRIHMSDNNLSKIFASNNNLNRVTLNGILEKRPYISGACVSTLVLNSRVTHFITDNDLLKRSVENSSPNIVTNYIGSTGNSKKTCIQIPLAPLPSKTWNLISGEKDVLAKIKDNDMAELEEALAEKVTVSDKVVVRRHLRLLKKKVTSKYGT